MDARPSLSSYIAKPGVHNYVLGLLLAQLPSGRLRERMRSYCYVAVYTQRTAPRMETHLVISVTIGPKLELRFARAAGVSREWDAFLRESAVLSPAELTRLMFALNDVEVDA